MTTDKAQMGLNGDPITPRMWAVAAAILTAIVAVQLLTITKGPNIQLDEAVIIDFGRTILDPHTDWSIDILPSGVGLATPSYLGCVLQELIRPVTSPSPLGPRVASMGGAILAVALLADWLSVLGTPSFAALGLGILFFLDPLFHSSYREARVDCWALALVFASCSVLARLTRDRRPVGESLLPLMSAGALSGVALFTWPTAVLLMPLVLWQAAAYSYRSHQAGERLSGLIHIVLRIAAGGLLTGILLLIPIQGLIRENKALPGLLHNNLTGRTQFTMAHVWDDARNLIAYSKISPIIPLGLLAGLLSRRNWMLLGITLLLLVVLLITWVYQMRVLYLFPYLYCMIAGLLATIAGKRHGALLQSAIVGGLLAWAAIISLGFYTASVLYWKVGKDPSELIQPAREYVGSGPKRVYLDVDALAFYYIGRELGWHMNRPIEEAEGTAEYYRAAGRILPRVDFALFRQESTPETKALLVRYGLAYEATLLNVPVSRVYPYRLALGNLPYGPFLLYTRRAAQRQSTH